MPTTLQESIGSHQHSEISFGQALGATIDLLIKNRLVPTLGERKSNEHKDEDFAAAQETLRKIDAHNRFMKRLGIACAFAVIVIVFGTCFWFWKYQLEKDELTTKRTELEDKYKKFLLVLNTDLSIQQMNTIDTLLMNMTEVYPDSIWMSQFEFSVGQWYGIKGESYDEAQKHLPMTNVSFGDVYSFFGMLGDMTNLTVDLPSVEVWEYAAHGGSNNETTLYVGNDDVDKVAWYKDNSGGKAHPSDGQQDKEPNHLDLYDMSGNVSELCNSPFEGGLYTICGGNFKSPASEVTANSRKGFAPDAKDETVGFRIIIRKE